MRIVYELVAETVWRTVSYMKTITRRTDKTKRKAWRDAIRSGEVDCHPIVKQLAFLLYTQDRSIVQLFKEAKVAPCMLSQWTAGLSKPQLRTITQILDVMGLELVIQTKRKD